MSFFDIGERVYTVEYDGMVRVFDCALSENARKEAWDFARSVKKDKVMLFESGKDLVTDKPI